MTATSRSRSSDECGSAPPCSSAAVQWLNAHPCRSNGSSARHRSSVEGPSSPTISTPRNGCTTSAARIRERLIPRWSASPVASGMPTRSGGTSFRRTEAESPAGGQKPRLVAQVVDQSAPHPPVKKSRPLQSPAPRPPFSGAYRTVFSENTMREAPESCGWGAREGRGGVRRRRRSAGAGPGSPPRSTSRVDPPSRPPYRPAPRRCSRRPACAQR